jgi:hypothetical protein
MITLTIDNPELERIFYEDFDGDNARFVEFLSQSCHANNVTYQLDNATIEAMIEEGEASGDSGLTHEEVFTYLREKYDIDQI